MQVIEAGANAIVAGSAVFKAKDYATGRTLHLLHKLILPLCCPLDVYLTTMAAYSHTSKRQKLTRFIWCCSDQGHQGCQEPRDCLDVENAPSLKNEHGSVFAR